MKISVVIPAYNCAEIIEKTVESILLSGLSEYEILIIDDGSKDGTDKVCDKVSKEYENIRCIHQENAGVSAARNCGIDDAEGEYILFFDADDSVDENAFERACELLESETPDMLIFGESFDYYHRGRMYRRDEMYYPKEVCFEAERWSKEQYAEETFHLQRRKIRRLL